MVDQGNMNEVKRICSCFRNEPMELLNILHAVNDMFGYVSEEMQVSIAKYLNVDLSTILVKQSQMGFSTINKQQVEVEVCMGAACYNKGAASLLALAQHNIGEVTIRGVGCVATCGFAPVVYINGERHAKVSPKQLALLLGI